MKKNENDILWIIFGILCPPLLIIYLISKSSSNKNKEKVFRKNSLKKVGIIYGCLLLFVLFCGIMALIDYSSRENKPKDNTQWKRDCAEWVQYNDGSLGCKKWEYNKR